MSLNQTSAAEAAIMDKFELLSRRYCAFLGENPDELIAGLPIWRIALADLEAAINTFDTFGIDVRSMFLSEGRSLYIEEQSRKIA